MTSLFSSPAQSSSVCMADWMNNKWCLVVAIAALLLVNPMSSVAQETRTQKIQLEQGWNLVSLNVQPNDSSFASIFGANSDQISMVKNEDGEVYVPGEGIEQITTWRGDEGYRILAESATTLEVMGAEVRPGSRPVVLEEGGNIVPYLSSTIQAVGLALASIKESLVAVEDESGVRYDPSASSSPLDSLRSSQGYKVYVDRRDTLQYRVVVPTLAEAKSLEGVEVGKTIRVQGYHEPGDSGGGTFEVTDSGEEIDGGTVFVFDEDVSKEQSYGISGWPTWNLPHSDVVWGTLGVRYGADPEDVLSDLDMHGHNRGGTGGWVDYKNGAIVGGAGNPLKTFNQNWGDGSQNYTVTYKYATSSRRFERVRSDDVFNLAWWGTPRADPENPVSATPYLAWAINWAAERYADGGIEWAYVDIPGEYYYLHETVIREGVMLRGVGPERPVPNRSFTTKGALTLMPGKAVYTQKDGYDPVAEHDIYPEMGASKSTFKHEQGASDKLGIQSLEMDGNLAQNEQVFTTSNYSGIESYLQNSGDWAAWFTNSTGGQSYQSGLKFYADNLYLHSYGGNVFASGTGPLNEGEGFDLTGESGASRNVHIGDAARNHQVYGLPGTMEDWSLGGIFWGTMLKIGSKSNRPATYRNLTLRDAPSNPYGYNTRDIVNTLGLNTVLDGFDFDLSDTGQAESLQRIWSDQNGEYDLSGTGNSGNVYKNGTIKLSSTTSITLIHSFGLHAPITWENITIEDNGGGIQIGSPYNSHSYNYFLENIDVIPQGDLSAFGGNPPYNVFGFTARNPMSSIPEATRNEYRDVSYQREFTASLYSIGYQGVSAPLHPHDQFFIDSALENKAQTLRGGISDANPWFRLYMDNTTVNIPTGHWSENFHKSISAGVLRLRDSQDRNGRTSDATGTYISDANDEGNDYVLVETNLMSRPQERNATITSGSRTVQSIEVANSDGTNRADDHVDEEDPYLRVNLDATIQDGNTIEVDWAARVTPLDEYRTTGLFVARPVENQSYTTANGPWTIDLRGMASTQESREKIVYTASSENASVVTTNVQSDGYTLELTEQGAGTAIITVTGTLDGVGSTTDTFEVSVE